MWISGDLIEKDPSIGGHMSQLSETFPTLDCSQCILTPRMVEVAQHPNITLYTYAELESLEGFIGNFKASIRLKAKSIDESYVPVVDFAQRNVPQRRFRANLMQVWECGLQFMFRFLRLFLISR